MLTKRIRKPKYLIIALGLLVAVGASAIAFWISKSESTTVASTEPPLAARLETAEGDVGIAGGAGYTEAEYSDDVATNDPGWFKAAANSPLTTGDRVYTGEDSRARIAFSARNYASINPLTSLDLLSLTDERTQLALRNGSAIFDVGDLGEGELFEVATPNCAVDFLEPGLYQIGIEDGGNTIISVLNGLAQVVGPNGTGQLSTGQLLTVAGVAAAETLVSRLGPDVAGGILNDYYQDRYRDYDGRYQDYDVYLNDPDYYDPYEHSSSYRNIGWNDVPGLYDLDHYGDWIDVDDYGRCWAPRVTSGWAPYRYGYWQTHDIWGPSWVSSEPWGWAPYHYGRWAFVNNQRWVWVPDRGRFRPRYSPALVAFIPIERTNQIGWCPLAPGEPYIPRYYSDFEPHYFGDRGVISQISRHRRFANLSVPDCVTAVPISSFSRFGGRGWGHRIDSRILADAQPVLDPFAIESVRRMAKEARRSRRSLRLPRELNDRIARTSVVTSTAPIVHPVQAKLTRALRAEAVAEKHKSRKAKFTETGQAALALRRDGTPQPPTFDTRRRKGDQQQPSQNVGPRQLSKEDRKARRDEALRLQPGQKAPRRVDGPMPPTRQVGPTGRPTTGVSTKDQKRLRKEQRQLQRNLPADQKRTKQPRRPEQNWQSNQPSMRAPQQRVTAGNQLKQQRQLRRAAKQAERQNSRIQPQRPSIGRAQGQTVQRVQREQRKAVRQRQSTPQPQHQVSKARAPERVQYQRAQQNQQMQRHNQQQMLKQQHQQIRQQRAAKVERRQQNAPTMVRQAERPVERRRVEPTPQSVRVQPPVKAAPAATGASPRSAGKERGKKGRN